MFFSEIWPKEKNLNFLKQILNPNNTSFTDEKVNSETFF